MYYEFPEKLFLEIKLPAAIVFNSFNSHLVEGSKDFVVIILSKEDSNRTSGKKIRLEENFRDDQPGIFITSDQPIFLPSKFLILSATRRRILKRMQTQV